MRRPAWLAAAAAGAMLVPAGLIAAPAAAQSSGSRPLVGSAPRWVSSAQRVGSADPASVLRVRLTLAPRDAAGAQTYAAAVSTPGSASYGRYLTPAQYAARFGPAATTLAAAKAFAAAAGLHVDAAANDALTVSGTVANLQRAFGTQLALFSRNGRSVRAPIADVSVPAALAGKVLAVTGLTDTAGQIRPHTVHPASPIKIATVGTPCSSYFGQRTVTLPTDGVSYEGTSWFGSQTAYPTAVCGYTPQQMRSAYGLGSGATGSGQSVAIIDAYASPTMSADINQYSANHGLPAMTASTYVEHLPAQFTDQALCDPAGWAGEESLDVDAVHSMAPAATIHYVATSSCEDSAFLAAYDTVLTGNGGAPLASVVSNSYGDTGEDIDAATRDAEHAYFVQGATEGVGFFFSSGDDGDETDNGLTPQPDASANDPAVTAVGGTSLGVSSTGANQFETGWGDQRTILLTNKKTKQSYWDDTSWSFYAGAGGGTSVQYAEPSYQTHVVPDALAADRQTGSRRGRVVPDIAADADPYTGFLYGQSTATRKGYVYAEGDIGGTSLAAPLVAGFMADVNQSAGHALGFVNPALYTNSVAHTLNDVLPASGLPASERGLTYFSPSANATRLIAFDQDSSYVTAAGYDRVTGLGTPTAAFLTALAAAH